ncbi:MAG TPA: dienelactone hydrolase family protein, partial [Candidatus Methylacidiphilales bacterium]
MIPLRSVLLLLALLVPLCGALADAPKFTAQSQKTQGIVIRLDDFGSADIAYLSLPDQPPVGGVVLAHDGWGLNWGVSNLADRLADAGYVVLVPDFFSSQTTTDPNRAAELMRDVTPETAMKTVGAAVRFLRESPRFRVPRVAVVGLGAGNNLALPAADPKAAAKAAGGKDVRLDALVLVGGPFALTEDSLVHIDKRADLLFFEGNAASADARAALDALLKDQKREARIEALPGGAEPSPDTPLPAASLPVLDAFLRASFAAPEKKGGVSGMIDSMNPFREK